MYSMRAVTLVVSFMFSHALAECAYGNETTCNDEADSSTLLQTMTYASESDDRCEGWCEEVPTDWAEKCAWPHCKGCASCGKCKEWCEQIPTEWSTKCAWKDCKACSSCSGTPPSPPPPAPPSPSSPYPGYAKKDGGYYGEPAGGYCEGSLDSVGRAWCILPRAKAREKCNELADCIGVSENTDAAWLGAMSAAKPEDAAQLGKGAFVSDSTWTTWKKGETAPPPSPPPPPPPSPPPANGAASGETGSEGTPGSVPDTIPDRFLNCHNYWRCIHGSPPIKWDKDVAQGSQEWANRGQMSHSDCYHIPPPQGPTGENLASGSSMSPEQACQMWHDESPEKGPSCGGHCTAMLWKSAYKLGCGVKGGLVVCRYGGKSLRDGTPNFGGRSEYRQNVGYPDNSKEAECKKQWPLSTKGSTNGGGGGRNPFGGGGGGSGNPFGSGGGGGNPFGGSGGGGGDPFGGSGGGSSPFGGSGGSR